MSKRPTNRRGAAAGALLVALGVAGLWFFLDDGQREQETKTAPHSRPVVPASRQRRAVQPQQTSRLGAQVPAGAQPEMRLDGELEIEVFSGDAPLPGAQVQLYTREPRDLRAPLLRWSGWNSGRTGADGRRVVPAAPGSYYVTARAEGLAPGYATVVHPPGSAHTRVRLSLEEAASLRGTTLVKGTGDPVSLAEIILTPPTFAPGGRGHPEAPEEETLVATSNEEGAFQLSGLAPGRYRVEARAPGYVSVVLPSVPIPFGGRITLELVPGGELEGVVLQADGHPADGAEVLVSSRERGVTTLADGEGHFSLEVPAGTYAVSARRGEASGALEGEVRLGVGQRIQGLRLQLGEGAWVSGKLVRWDGAPVPGARVEARFSRSLVVSGTALTDERGAFSLSGLTADTYLFRVVTPHGSHFDHGPLTLAPGENTSLTLTYDPRGNLGCKVWDSRNRGVEGIRVQVSGLQPHVPSESPVVELRTDASGFVSFMGLPVGRVRVEAMPDARSPGIATTALLREGADSECTLHLPDEAALEDGAVLVEGQVLLSSGEPATGPVLVTSFRQRPTVDSFREFFVDAQGRFRLALAPGQYSLRASLQRGVGCGGKGRLILQVEAGRPPDATILLDEIREPDLRLLLLESNGAPARRAPVEVSMPGFGQSAQTDEEGRLYVCLAPEKRQANAPLLFIRSFDDTRAAVLQETQGQHDFTLPLLPWPTVRAHVLSGNQVPVRHLLVDVTSSMSIPPLELTSDRFTLHLPPGQSQFLVTVNETMRASVVLDLQPGENRELEIPTAPGASLSGRLVDAATRRPVMGASVVIPPFQHMDSTAEGHFAFSNLPVGEHFLHVYYRATRRAMQRVELLPSQANDVGDIAISVQ